MAKKTVVAFILAGLLLSAGLYAVSGKSVIPQVTANNDIGSVEARAAFQLSEHLDSSQSAGQAITTVYNSDAFGILGITRTGEIMKQLSVARRSLYDVNEAFPIEYLRGVNDHLLYVVYKVETKHKEPYHMYLFFEKLESMTEQVSTETELWRLTGRVMFAARTLSYEDFGHIDIGSSLADVAKIDPITLQFKPQDIEPHQAQKYDHMHDNYVEYTESPQPVLNFTAYHLLTDGIFMITYSRDSHDEEFVVSGTSYHESSEITSLHHAGMLPLKIHTADFPQ